MQHVIGQMMEGNWQSPSTGESVTVPIEMIAIDSGVSKHARDIVDMLELGERLLVVSDVNTNEVLGHELVRALKDEWRVEKCVLGNGVRPDESSVHTVLEQARGVDAILAVGSGTLNDICKYVGNQLDKPHVIFGTAPSMNGYASANASIIQDGFHHSLPAQLPTAIILDTDILSASPKRLIQSGIADSLCRTTAQVDWLLSHWLLGTYYNPIPFELLEPYEAVLFEQAEALMNVDKEAMTHLAHLLVLSGIGMTIAGGSYPASQGEHMIAHTMDMLFGDTLPQTYHGEQIAVTTLTTSLLQRHMLDSYPKLSTTAERMQRYRDQFGNSGVDFFAPLKIKNIDKMRAKELNDKILDGWEEYIEQVVPYLIPYETIKQVLETIGAPTDPDDLGWDSEDFHQAVQLAPLTRDRFTFLDLM